MKSNDEAAGADTNYINVALAVLIFSTIFLPMAILLLGMFFVDRSGDGVLGTPGGLGQFGDFLGGTLNPSIGVLTVLGLTLTVWMQRKAQKEAQIDARKVHIRDSIERHGDRFEALIEKRIMPVRLTGIEQLWHCSLDDLFNGTTNDEPGASDVRYKLSKRTHLEAGVIRHLSRIERELTEAVSQAMWLIRLGCSEEERVSVLQRSVSWIDEAWEVKAITTRTALMLVGFILPPPDDGAFDHHFRQLVEKLELSND